MQSLHRRATSLVLTVFLVALLVGCANPLPSYVPLPLPDDCAIDPKIQAKFSRHPPIPINLSHSSVRVLCADRPHGGGGRLVVLVNSSFLGYYGQFSGGSSGTGGGLIGLVSDDDGLLLTSRHYVCSRNRLPSDCQRLPYKIIDTYYVFATEYTTSRIGRVNIAQGNERNILQRVVST